MTYDIGTGGIVGPYITVGALESSIPYDKPVLINWSTNQSGMIAVDLHKNGTKVKSLGTVSAASNVFSWTPVSSDGLGDGFSIMLTMDSASSESSQFSLYMLPNRYPQKDMSIDTCTSWESASEDGKPENVLDGYQATIWHSKYSGGSGDGSFPHEIVFSLDGQSVNNILGFIYTPRSDGENGKVKDYSFYFSEDGNSFTKVEDDTLTYNGSSEIPVIFTSPVSGKDIQYVKFKATSSKNGERFAAMAEFNLLYDEYVSGDVEVNSLKTTVPTSLQLARISRNSLSLEIPKAGTYQIELFTLNGRKLFSTTRSLAVGNALIKNSVSSSGVYIVSISGGETKATFKSILR